MKCKIIISKIIYYLRALLNSFIKGVAHFTLGGQCGSFLNESVVDIGVNECSGAGAAALTHVGEDGVVRDHNSFIHFYWVINIKLI